MDEDVTLIRRGNGIVECRICGLNFLPALQEDRERHEKEHLKVLAGGLPYKVREFLKKAAWEVIANEDLSESPESLESAKRALASVYSWPQ